MVVEIDPKTVDNAHTIYFEKFLTSETMFHDCFVHSVNFGVRACYFRRREQVIAFLRDRLHIGTTRAIEMKVKQGLPTSIFQDFFVKESRSYSIKQIRVWIDDNGFKWLD